MSTNVETPDGSLDRTVEDIYLMEIDGKETLDDEVESVGEYESDGVIQIDGTSGLPHVDMQTIEIIRVSDLATYSREVTSFRRVLRSAILRMRRLAEAGYR